MGKYTDLDFFQNYTRTEYSTSTEPTSATVEEYIDMSEQEIDEKSGRTWNLETHTDELYDKPNQELLLNNYPVINITKITDGNGVELTKGIDSDYIIDGDFVIFNPSKSRPLRVYVSYTSGYSTVRAAAKMLATLLTIQKLRQSQSSTQSNTQRIKLGAITIDKSLGLQTVLNLDKNIDRYWLQLRRLIR